MENNTTATEWDEESEEFKAERKIWGEMARDSSVDFPTFLNRIFARPHDYGTICHAMSTAIHKAMDICNDHPGAGGGITGFQAQFIMWRVIQDTFHVHSNTGLRMLDYDWLLSPQYENRFTTIPSNVWASVVEEAKKRIEKCESGEDFLAASVRDHIRNVSLGMVPFGLKIEKVEETDELPDEANQ